MDRIEEVACLTCPRQSDCDSLPTLNGIPKHARCKEQLDKAKVICSLFELKPDESRLLGDKEMISAINRGRKGNKRDRRDGTLVSADPLYIQDHIYVAKAQDAKTASILEPLIRTDERKKCEGELVKEMPNG